MFERFTTDLREAVRLAQEQARELGHGCIGTEHFLLGLSALDRGIAAELLRERGVTEAALRRVLLTALGDDLDAEGLAAIGIDLDQVRRAADAEFGPGALAPVTTARRRGHLPLTGRAKVVLSCALREARSRGGRAVDTGDLLVALLRDGHGLAVTMLGGLEIDLDALGRDLRDRLERAA